MTPEELAELIIQSLRTVCAAGKITLAEEDIPVVNVERPRARAHGDWSTNIAMQLAKKAGMPPRDLANILGTELEKAAGIKRIEIAGPGFLNIYLQTSAAGELARTILTAGANYGVSQRNSGQIINLEFVSANPTGPIHIGGARWAAVGDSLARILEATGAEVVREYYFNDHGAQIDRFSASLLARALGEAVPENGYGGEYIAVIAEQVQAEHPDIDISKLSREKAQEFFRKYGVEKMFAEIKTELSAFRVQFDVYFHEASLYESGEVNTALAQLQERGAIYEKDSATWVRTTEFGDDKDRVVIKSNGETAYFAGDIAYYLNKRRRGSDCAIYLLGADHHGYIGRMYALARAFGDEAGPGKNMEILIGQLVNLVRDGVPVRMSKRAGNVVVLGDLVDAAGVDAARYSLVRAAMDTPLEIDLSLISSHTNENPVYYVQYAHARICSVARNAKEHGVERVEFDPSLLNTQADNDLLATLARYPEVVAQAAELREPHRIARYVEEVAGAYHAWYGKSRVTPRGDDPVTATHSARLWLNDAAGQVLANGLGLLGVEAPQQM